MTGPIQLNHLHLFQIERLRNIPTKGLEHGFKGMRTQREGSDPANSRFIPELLFQQLLPWRVVGSIGFHEAGNVQFKYLALFCWVFSDFRANSPPNHRQNVQGLDLAVQILDGLLDGRSDISQISSLAADD